MHSRALELLLVELASLAVTIIPTEAINLAHSGQLALPAQAVGVLLLLNSVVPPMLDAVRRYLRDQAPATAPAPAAQP